jgi:hypothetical protein
VSRVRVVAVLVAFAAVLAPAARAEMVGEQSVLVVLATYGPRPYTIDSIAAAVKQTDQFFRASSFGQTHLKTRIVPYINAFASAPRFCGWDDRSLEGLISPARSTLQQQGYNLVAWDRIVYIVVGANCSFHGAAFGREAIVTEAPKRWLLVHELGHTYGLSHAASTQCAVCPVTDRGDPFSPMGEGPGFKDFSTYEKAELGWLPAPLYLRRSGRYRLALATARSKLSHALVIAAPNGQYWVERRAGQGLLIRFVDPETEAPPFLAQPVLLMDPTGRHRPWVAPGETFRVPGAFNANFSAGRVRFAWAQNVAPSTPHLLSFFGARAL